MKTKAKKFKTMKPYKTWQAVNVDGSIPYGPEHPRTSKAQILSYLVPSHRLARVEVREI